MSRDSKFYLEDILNCCEKILHYTDGISFEKFCDDERTYDAVLRNLEIIGEAAKRMDVEICKQLPEIEWRKIAGLRNIISHAYFGIDDDIIWDIVVHKIPQLVEVLKPAFKKMYP